eukprot:4795124-Prymnesium_polylepis.1
MGLSGPGCSGLAPCYLVVLVLSAELAKPSGGHPLALRLFNGGSGPCTGFETFASRTAPAHPYCSPFFPTRLVPPPTDSAWTGEATSLLPARAVKGSAHRA